MERVTAWVLLITAAAAIGLGLLVPRLTGATPYVVETGSMAPSLPPGTLVVVKPVASDEVSIGDVITYQVRSGDPTVVTHRVVAAGLDMTGQPRWRTQGDANEVADATWVRPVQLRGEKWYAVPYLGYATSFITEQQRSALTILLLLLLSGYAVAQLHAAYRERRRTVTSASCTRHRRRQHAVQPSGRSIALRPSILAELVPAPGAPRSQGRRRLERHS